MIRKWVYSVFSLFGLLIYLTTGKIYSTVVTSEKLLELRDFLSRVPQLGQFARIIRENSSAVVLIYSISSKVPVSQTANGGNTFYNIAVKPRTSEFDYRYGVISGVVISNDGVVVTLYDCVKYADEFIVSVDSEKRTDKPDGAIVLTKNDFKAKIIKAIPELDLAFLKIEIPTTQATRNFNYLNIANDASITSGKVKHYLLNGGIVYGKCRAEETFVSDRNPGVNTNSFKDYRFFCSRISSDIFEGARRLVIYNPVLNDQVCPEVHGGALITLDSSLLGLAIYQKDIAAPMSYAIPSSIIKRGMQLATPWLIKLSEDSSLGIKVAPLDEKQKKQLISIMNKWDESLLSDIVATFSHTIDGQTFGKLQDEVKNGHCGVVVNSIIENGISSNAGVNQGDIILTVQGTGVTSTKCFYNLEAQAIGEQYVELRVVPLSQNSKTSGTILYVPIYKNTDATISKNQAIEQSPSKNNVFGIIKKIKQWIANLKSEDNLIDSVK